jgi:signal transduction histidine kinase/AmiR/NasT family two-component response regulator
MPRSKTRRSLGIRLIFLILLGALFLSAVTVTIGYRIYRDSREQGYIRLGQNLTKTVRNIIDGDSLDKYLLEGVTDQAYENTLWLMQNIRESNNITYLYVTRLAEGGWRFVYDAGGEGVLVELGYLDPYDENYPEFREQVLSGTVDPIVSKTNYGWLLSVYEPIHNSKGELVGYVGADFSMDEIVAERRSYLLHLIFLTVLISAVFAVLYILEVRRTLILPINAMAAAADSYLAMEEGTALSSIGALDIHTNDELESLAEAIKSMDRKINLTIIDLKKAEEDALAGSRAKTAFLAQMSHELRTPMNAIMGMARAALYVTEDGEKTAQALKEILASSQRLLTVLNDILDISNIESGKLVLTRDVFSMADVCRSLNDLTRLQCGAKELTFFPDIYQVSDIVVWGDRVRLMQVAGNILNNAVKFTGKGGEIRFAAELREQTAETVSIRFTVSDTGIGISPEQQKRLFQAFVPVDREISVKYGGIGAKLSICQSIVEMMGGGIKVESKIGRGSVFSFELVFDKASAKEQEEFREAQAASSQPPASADFSGKKILVVDDVIANRTVVKIALKNTGADITEAKDGRQALEILTSLDGEIDLVLMDISMPNMNGYEATRAIRALDTGWAKKIPIIPLTAHTYQEDVDAALEAGMDFHLGKPLNFDTLLSTIAHYFSAAKKEAPLNFQEPVQPSG